MRTPKSTYRLQVNENFGLSRAAAITDYLRELGADWVYLSPLLQAEAGSDHGYDVVDHSRVDRSRGGPDGLKAAADAAHSNGLGVLIDIVPNHVGIATPEHSVWWWDVLTHGRDSRYAEAFDIDWEFGGGRVRVPVIGDEDEPGIRIDEGFLVYGDLRFPIAPGTATEGASASEVHDQQPYELVNWRRADAELNYRRFFAVNTLAGIRVEVPWVFEESHAEIVRWVREGLADGLRVDHPDGLADPGAYLDALAAATGGTYVLVEKILERGEILPSTWATAGTTGYDALAEIDSVLIDPAGRIALDSLDSRLRNETAPLSWQDLIHSTKRSIADGILRSEVLRIERDLGASVAQVEAQIETETEGDALEQSPISRVADGIAELLTCFPVYRSYLPLGAGYLLEAARDAVARRPDLEPVIGALVTVFSDPGHPAAIRFQQTSGMVMAKGVEDTAFYRYNRLGSLTEVGEDPQEFAIDVSEFHRRQQLRQSSFPAAMTTLSTHDTKRGEDVRARLSVFAEMPDEWDALLASLREAAPLPDGPLEELLWQAIIGAWPASRDRLHAYAEKAAREAGVSTRWSDPAEDFERRMHALIDSAFDDPAVADRITAFVERVAAFGWSNSLSAKLIQLAAPGVPDVYQGSELWETSLVDPDNRRPVDFDIRRLYLAAIDTGILPEIDESGAAKLLITSKALRLRRDHPELFSRYVPVPAYGPAAGHAVIFDRGDAIAVATRLPVGLERAGGWRDTTVSLASRALTDVITGRQFAGGTLELGELLSRYPVALLVPTPVLRGEAAGTAS